MGCRPDSFAKVAPDIIGGVGHHLTVNPNLAKVLTIIQPSTDGRRIPHLPIPTIP
jgi:hypothetical protein